MDPQTPPPPFFDLAFENAKKKAGNEADSQALDSARAAFLEGRRNLDAYLRASGGNVDTAREFCKAGADEAKKVWVALLERLNASASLASSAPFIRTAVKTALSQVVDGVDKDNLGPLKR